MDGTDGRRTADTERARKTAAALGHLSGFGNEHS